MIKKAWKSFKLFLIFIIAASLLWMSMTGQAAASYTAAPQAWIVDSADKAYDGSTMPANHTASISLHAARGEYEAAQICIRNNGGTAMKVNSFTLGDLSRKGGGGKISAAFNMTVRREYIHRDVSPMEEDTGASTHDEKPAAGSTGYPDALVGVNDILGWFDAACIDANKTGIYWYSVYIPQGQTAGNYSGTISIRTGAGDVLINVSVVVYNVMIPEAGQSSFKMNNWVFASGPYPLYDVIVNHYGYAKFSPEWWKVLANWAADLKKHRNNVIYLDIADLLVTDSTIDDNGSIHFDWHIFDRFVQTFIDAGAGRYLRTFPMIGERLVMNGIQISSDMAYIAPYKAGSEASEAYLDQMFPALRAHLEEKTKKSSWPGWKDFFYLSAYDEPYEKSMCDAANWLYVKYHKYFPGGKTMDTAGILAGGCGGDSTGSCPLPSFYYDNIGYYRKQILAGKELWFYVCCVPTGGYMNRYISQQLDKSRLLFWDCWRNGATGYLHWGWDIWNGYTQQGTFDDNHPDYPQNGDPFIVRPDLAGKTVYDSIRYEAQLDGLEDYELLKILSVKKPITAKRIADSLIKGPTEYTLSGMQVTAAHKKLLDAIVSPDPDTAPSYSVFTSKEYRQTDMGTWHNRILENCAVGLNFTLSFDVKINKYKDSDYTHWAGCIVRSLDSGLETGYEIILKTDGNIAIAQGGDYVTREAAVPGYKPGQYINIRVVADNGKIKVYADGKTSASKQPLLEYNDKTAFYTAGNVGLVTYYTDSSFRNIIITQGIKN